MSNSKTQFHNFRCPIQPTSRDNKYAGCAKGLSLKTSTSIWQNFTENCMKMKKGGRVPNFPM